MLKGYTPKDLYSKDRNRLECYKTKLFYLQDDNFNLYDCVFYLAIR